MEARQDGGRRRRAVQGDKREGSEREDLQSLSKAVKSRDADAIAGAVRAVNDPKAAKEKSGAEARAKAEREAAEQATGSTGGSAGSYASGSPRTYSGNSGFYGTKRNYEQLNTTQASRQN